MRSVRETADQRKLIRDAVTALRASTRERLDLGRTLSALADAVPGPITLDSLYLQRVARGWSASMSGGATAETNGRAVQVIHEFYRDLPSRVAAEQLALERLWYADSSAASTVRFQLSFVIPAEDR